MNFAAFCLVDDHWSASKRLAPMLHATLEVAVYVKKDDAVAANASKDANRFEIRVALHRKSNVSGSKLLIKAGFKGCLPQKPRLAFLAWIGA